MSHSTTQIETKAETHRANITGLIEELRTRATPGEVMDQFLGWDEGQEIARTLGRQVAGNPLPLALIGTGVAWLMFSDTMKRRNGSYSSASKGVQNGSGIAENVSDGLARGKDAVSGAADHVRSAANDAGENIKGAASQVSDSAFSAVEYGRQTASDLGNRAQGAYQKAKETMSAASDSVTATANSAWQKTTEMTQSAGDTIRGAGDTIRDTGSSISNLAQDQPLLAAGLGFALGMALGAMLPTTEAEHSLLGEQSRAAKEKAGDLVGQGYQKAKAVAQKGLEAGTQAVQEEAQNQGLASSDQEDTSGQAGESRTSLEGPDARAASRDEQSYLRDNGDDYRSGGPYSHH